MLRYNGLQGAVKKVFGNVVLKKKHPQTILAIYTITTFSVTKTYT